MVDLLVNVQYWPAVCSIFAFSHVIIPVCAEYYGSIERQKKKKIRKPCYDKLKRIFLTSSNNLRVSLSAFWYLHVLSAVSDASVLSRYLYAPLPGEVRDWDRWRHSSVLSAMISAELQYFTDKYPFIDILKKSVRIPFIFKYKIIT